MKIQFDKQQQYQLDAIQAVIDVFDGQPTASGQFAVRLEAGAQGFLTDLGFGNQLEIERERIAENVREVQRRNGILMGELFDGLDFSVEMETGTGKTYTYLRTIHELHAKYGFTKFIIVVPSVAIREGVLKTLAITREHFAELYDQIPYDYWVYDSKVLSSLRQFASSNHLQILVMNIDAFNKKENNVIHREQDRLSGRKPIEFIQSTQPVVILDEPQNMESELAKEAIASLNPLCTLRYSATHRNMYNLLYRLGPVQAYQRKLVKRIEVASVMDAPDFKRPYLRLESITAAKAKITAKLTMDVQGKNGPVRKTVSISKSGTDLFDLSKQREAYRGYIVDEIDSGSERISFANGVSLTVGQSLGAHQDEIMRAQIFEAVQEHLRKEWKVHREFPQGKRVKVLTLFFIDRVANYAEQDGKIRRWFEEAYSRWFRHHLYKPLQLPPVDKVHNGYFAADKQGKAKDTSGRTQADDEAFELIMRDKERLLSLDEPLRFIFSHSALREGWDNPNVFQICTLNETRSDLRKRQEIGRGLRLPVDETGNRLLDHPINRLTIIANESYDDFARTLQNEIEEETGEKFPAIDSTKKKRVVHRIDRWAQSLYFKELWESLKHKTRYSVQYATPELIEKAARAVHELPIIQAPRLKLEKWGLDLTEKGVSTRMLSVRQEAVKQTHAPLPDFIGYIQRQTELTRGTIAQILIRSGRLDDVFVNAQQFLDLATRAIRNALQTLMVDKIRYELTGEEFEMLRKSPQSSSGFEEEIEVAEDRLVEVKKSLYPAIEVQSKTEAQFAVQLEDREDVLFFLKLPGWFKVQTPLGSYNPDWAIVLEAPDGFRMHFVCETKASTDERDLRPDELDRNRSAGAHFSAVETPFLVVQEASQISHTLVGEA